jgi:hypothetical protein
VGHLRISARALHSFLHPETKITAAADELKTKGTIFIVVVE